MTRNLAEFPIHFEDRVAGDSRISKPEIFKAILTLSRLGFMEPGVEECELVEPSCEQGLS